MSVSPQSPTTLSGTRGCTNRDIVLPLGLVPNEEDDELLACLRNAAALNAAFALMAGVATPTTFVLESTEPEALIVLAVDESVQVCADAVPPGAVVIGGRAVDLVEMLSTRVPFDQTVPDDKQWLISGLADIFEVA